MLGISFRLKVGNGFKGQEAGEGGEKKSFHTHSNGSARRGEEGTYNLIFGELLDEQKDHVRGAVLCVAEGVREWACGRRGGQHR